MKKYYLLLLLVFTGLQSFSQGISFTVFAEPQLGWLSPNTKKVEAAGPMIGFNGGMNFDNYFAQNYAFSTGASINNVNGKIKYKEPASLKGLDSTYTINTNDVVEYHTQYINIPIGLKFKTIEIGYTRFYAHLGMDANINIKAKANIPREENIDATKEIHWYNLGYYIGGGVEYSLGGTTAIVAGLTYKNGFLDITEAEDNKITTGNISLRMGILF
ncbi:MAG: porin family protein [Bacteroidales bacterium]|nr:PorT family protein [Bacteroidales bacterium]MBS3776295.1 PorT family protein [Bacteroidales bacterium]